MLKNCSNIKQIVLPNSLKKINSDAFNGCASLKSIDIPSGVKEIESGAFENCPTLTRVTVKSGIPPKVNKSSFSKSFLYEGTLFVPVPSSYKSNPKLHWSKFRNVEAIKL